MTAKDLNRDVKRLYQQHFQNGSLDNNSMTTDQFFDWVENYCKSEFMRLYYADGQLQYLNRDNIIRMMIMNRKRRFVPFHLFYIGVNESKII